MRTHACKCRRNVSILIVFWVLCLTFCTPWAHGDWEAIGPEGGWFIDYAFDPSNADVIFAGSDDSGGIWKTTNGGTSWSLVTSSLRNVTAWDLAVKPGDFNTIYACDCYGRFPVLKTTNGGTTWTEKRTGLPTYVVVSAIAVDPTATSTVYCGTGDQEEGAQGVYKSTNGGDNWAYSGLDGNIISKLTIDDAGNVFVSAHNPTTGADGIYKSTNDGSSWTSIRSESCTTLAIGPTSDNLWAGTATMDADANAIMSTDAGTSWQNCGLGGMFIFQFAIKP